MKTQMRMMLIMIGTLLFHYSIAQNSGNFKTIMIGKQEWMIQNLDVGKFNNGDPIPVAMTNEEWLKAGEDHTPAWCYYKNLPANGKKYGRLYNWYAINDPRGLAPAGWHIPSDEEWTKLIDHLGGADVAGAKIKTVSGWKENGNGTNESNFTGLPAGNRQFDGEFYNLEFNSYWASSTADDATHAWIRVLYSNDGHVGRYNDNKANGISVRCIRD